MKECNIMSSEEKWKAVVNCDKRYDGLFYYAVKTTGIFCRPSCKAKTPLRKNVLLFNTPDDAKKAGFRECKMCRPDMKEHSYEPGKELSEKAMEILNQNYNKELNFKLVSQEIGVSDSHLARLFKKYHGFTPSDYIIKIRINKSKKLLLQTNLDILSIAYEVGFKSLSNFYKYFKEQVGSTPKKYREVNSLK